MRVSAVFCTAARCCNTANSSLTIDEKFEILNKRIGSCVFESFVLLIPHYTYTNRCAQCPDHRT